jgi:leader peptidase (prepilin peptidase)/N-methyltransferase
MGAGVAGVCVLVWLVMLCVYDIRERRLPNALTLPGAVVIVGVAAAAGRGMPALFGGVALFGVYLLVHLLATSSSRSGSAR